MNPPGLPLRPWWHHPNHRYEGKHRGTYQYRLDVRLPEGIIYLGDVIVHTTWFGVVTDG